MYWNKSKIISSSSFRVNYNGYDPMHSVCYSNFNDCSVCWSRFGVLGLIRDFIHTLEKRLMNTITNIAAAIIVGCMCVAIHPSGGVLLMTTALCLMGDSTDIS